MPKRLLPAFLAVLGAALLLPGPRLHAQATGGDASIQPADTNHVAASIAWLNEAAPALQLEAAGLRLRYQRRSPGGIHLFFNLTWHGLDVYGATAKLDRLPGGRFIHHHIGFPPPAQLQAVPSPRFALGTDTIARHALSSYGGKVYALRPVLFPDSLAGLLPAYHIILEAGRRYPLSDLVLSADDARPLFHGERSRHYAKTMMDTSGTAEVFRPDPLTTAGVTYGTPYVDSADAPLTVLMAETVPVTLQGLAFSNDTFRLKGPHVWVQDLDFPFNPVVTTTDGDFRFARDTSGFEDVMAYYHLDTYQRYVQSLGFMNLRNGPMWIDAQGQSGDNSTFFPMSGPDDNIRMGTGGVDDAEDADVLIHEYGHALSYAAAPGTNSGFIREGIDEGWGDYFAASYSIGLSTNAWERTFTWDGHNEFWPGRRADLGGTWPAASKNNIWEIGAYWASTLMAVRQQIPNPQADAIVLQALFLSSPSMTIQDAAQNILRADTMLNSGQFSPPFLQEFCARGILTGAECSITGREAGSGRPAPLRVWPNPAATELHFRSSVSSGTYALFGPQGRRYRSGRLSQGKAAIGLQGLSAGVYLLRVSGGEAPQHRRVLVRP